MSSYIDANKLIEFIDSKFVVSWEHDYDGGFKDACIAILNAVEEAPTIDIVCCRECKYFENHNCVKRSQNFWRFEDFCSYGERREE